MSSSIIDLLHEATAISSCDPVVHCQDPASYLTSMLFRGAKPVSYGDKKTTWSILLLKTRELAHNLTGKTKELDFVSPEFGVKTIDSHEIRQKILNISYADEKS